jgi:hypothetical protein
MKIRASGYIAPDLIAAVPTELDDEDPYSRFLMFQDTTEQQVADVDIPRTVVSVCAYPFESDNENVFVALTNEGDLYFLTEEVDYEKIPGAGVLSEDAEDLGSTLAITHKAGILYVCGDGSQVYFRPTKDEWVRICERDVDGMANNFFEGIAAVGPNKLAVCGYTHSRPKHAAHGCLYFYNDGKWSPAELPNNQSLYDLVFVDGSRLVAVGGGGTIVAGTGPGTMEDASVEGLLEKFLRIRFDLSKLYVLGKTAIFVFDTKLNLLETLALPSEYSSPKNIEVKQGIIWYFDREGLARHDGAAWTLMPVPPELLERSE